ncbi:hypothetical protein DSTSK_30290 [Desulforhabdus sp. TSK]|nr:hypothetical protein DSTSK_30290 [Desulforhabdus sp. TSK]
MQGARYGMGFRAACYTAPDDFPNGCFIEFMRKFHVMARNQAFNALDRMDDRCYAKRITKKKFCH